MAIPNVSSLYKRIHSGSEGGNEFARVMNLLLVAEAKAEGWNIEPYSDASGDYEGLDLIIEKKAHLHNGFHFKFYPSPLTAAHKTKIIHAIEQAKDKASDKLNMVIVVTPEDLMKEDKEWLKDVKRRLEKKKYISEHMYQLFLGIEHWGYTRIMELMLRHPHIAKSYYPEIFSYDTDLFKIAGFVIDKKNFIFDFSFTNDTNSTYLLSHIELIRINVKNELYGIPDASYLKSLGKLEFQVNMKNEINELLLKDPIIFKSNNQIRFELQLLNFDTTLPGNTIEMKFRFYFNQKEFFIETRPIHLVVLR